MEHPGIVTAVKPGFVTVQITSVSACAACQAHSQCGFAESKTKTLDIPFKNDHLKFNVGDKVTVTIDRTHGLLASWWAYFVPALLLLAAVIGFSLTGISEPAVILLSLAILGVYVLLLYLLRKRLDSKFTLTVEKHPLT
ncbi:MAG: SoxR reducing system RseC family protein [bacterium]